MRAASLAHGSRAALGTVVIGTAVAGSAVVAAPGCMLFVGSDTYTTDAGAAPGARDASNGGSDADASTTTDAGADETNGGEAGGPAVEAGTGVCAPGLNEVGCAACWKSACCSPYAACLADPECAALVTCVQGCTAPPCSCAASTASTNLFVALVNCTLTTSTKDTTSPCASCPILGTGDPCVRNDQCVGANSCFVDPDCTSASPIDCASWCGPGQALGCVVNSDCYGSFSGMANANGFSNACVTYDDAGNANCFPQCDPTMDACAPYYGGGSCTPVADIAGNRVSVCR